MRRNGKVAWESKTLGEVCGFVRGPFGGSLKKSVFVEDGFAVYEQQHAIYDQFDEIRYFIDDAKFREMQRFELHPKDLIMSCSGTMGKVAIVPDNIRRGVINQALLKLTASSTLAPEFLKYWMGSADFQDALKEQSGGAAIQNVASVGILKQIQISLPPIPEQRRIVGILDEAFEGIATAKANAEKNLQNARALFESHLQSVFAAAWQTSELVPLSDLATDITDGDHLPPPKAPTGVPFITIGNIVKDTRKIDFTDTFMVPRAYFDGLKASKKPRRGDVLYTVTGSFGIPVVVDDDGEFCFQRHIGLIRPKPQTTTSWLSYLLLSPQVFKQASEGATGTAQKTVSLNVLRGFKVPNVPPAQQRAAAARLDALSEETQRLASIYQQKLAALDELKKSLLHQAFSGEL
jgi:type I restriction enzyme S subunit